MGAKLIAAVCDAGVRTFLLADLEERFGDLCRDGSRALVILGVGIGTVSTAFSVLYGTVLRGLPFEEASRLVHFERANPVLNRPSMSVTPHDYMAWREEQETLRGFQEEYGAGTPHMLCQCGQPAAPEGGPRMSIGLVRWLAMSG